MATSANRYSKLIETIFLAHYEPGNKEVVFPKDEIETVAAYLKVVLPKNLADILYVSRNRPALPPSVRDKAPAGMEWIIRPAGRARYKFVAVTSQHFVPNQQLVETKVPDSTPGVIAMYQLSDEQELLAIIRYNRLIDVFTGISCYSLQNNLRTSVKGLGQVETDEIYIGLDQAGTHYALPVQVCCGNDKLSVVQVEHDMRLCAEKFPHVVCRPIGAQFLKGDAIVLFEFERQGDEMRVSAERHYRLVTPDELTTDELKRFLSKAR